MLQSLLQAAACSTPQPLSAQECGVLVRGQRKGKSMPHLQRAQGGGEQRSTASSPCAAVGLITWRWGRPSLVWEAGGGVACALSKGPC